MIVAIVMDPPGQPMSPADLHRRRQSLLRGLTRANYAAAIIVVVVIIVALVAIMAAFRAERNAAQAFAASAQAREELQKARLAQARAQRLSGAVGRRQQGLDAVAAAARIHPSLELRNEAIGLLALVDIDEQGAFWAGPPNNNDYLLDPDVERYLWTDAQGVSHLARFADDRELLRLVGPSAPVSGAFSPTGKRLVMRYRGSQLWIWDLERGQTIARITCGGEDLDGAGLAVSADGRWLAVGEVQSRRIRLFEMETGKEFKAWQVDQPRMLAFHPREPILAEATGRDEQLRFWNWQTGALVESRQVTAGVSTFGWSADGRSLAAGTFSGDVLLYDLVRNRTNVLTGHTAFVSGVMFNHEGTLLATRSWDGSTRLWDPATARFLLSTHRGYALQFSRDDTRLAYLLENRGVGFWHVVSKTPYRAFRIVVNPNEYVSCSGFGPDGRSLVAFALDGVHVIDPGSGSERRFIPMPNQWSDQGWLRPGGTTLVAASAGGLSIWPLSVGSNGAPGAGAQPAPRSLLRLQPGQRITDLHFTADGTQALVGLANQGAVLIGLEDGRVAVGFTNHPALASCAISSDKKWVVTSTRRGGGTRLWNAQTGTPERQLDDRDANVDFSPDGRWLMTACGYAYVLWDTTTWQPRHTFRHEATSGAPGRFNFSPDGTWLALAQTERLVQLIDMRTLTPVAELSSPNPLFVNRVLFSPDATTLAVSAANELQLWDLAALRRELVKLNLDWGEGSRPLEGERRALVGGPDVRRQGNHLNFSAVVAGAGVVVALGFALVVFQRLRQLMLAYLEVEAMVAQRNQELELAQRELLLSQKMKALGTMAAGIAHDFNNLLSIIRMANKSVVRETCSQPGIAEDTKDIEEAVLQGKSIVQSMLGYSREALGSPGLYRVTEVVQETVSLLSKQFLSGLALELDLPPTIPPVNGSRGRVKQILLNLIVNASEAMNGRGTLRLEGRLAEPGPEASFVLRARAARQYIELSVIDTGPGIASDTVTRIFEPFFTTKVSGLTRGTGLGLSLVYSLAQQEGLGLRVDSDRGKGAAFRILIPVE
ncbi:MAG: ATP-binding protein [Limisphaerales bacterium]